MAWVCLLLAASPCYLLLRLQVCVRRFRRHYRVLGLDETRGTMPERLGTADRIKMILLQLHFYAL